MTTTTKSKIVIDRQRWGRGKGGGKLADRNRQNCCCLGFAANQLCGIPWNAMRGKEMPWQITYLHPQHKESLIAARLMGNSKICGSIYFKADA